MIKNIFVVSGSRADYGLLYYLIKGIKEDEFLKLSIVATGMHLSESFGNTYTEIEKDFKINFKVPVLNESDSAYGITRSIGDGVSNFGKLFQDNKPDLLIILGDRYEILAASIAALIHNIPIAHLHGGEKTEGAFDEAIRHSITKMSHIHFVSHNEYRDRVIQLGEQPENVFNVGALGIENIKKLSLLNLNELEGKLNFKFSSRNLLVTFHPETLGKKKSIAQIQELFNALIQLKDTQIIITLPNADPEGLSLIAYINEFASSYSNFHVFKSLGQLKYLSCIKYVDGVIGNSSSGILEVPSFKKGTINIGDRQKGRIQSDSIINCSANTKDILLAIDSLYSKTFQKGLKYSENPYGDGSSSGKIISIIKKINTKNLLMKSFYDLNLKEK